MSRTSETEASVRYCRRLARQTGKNFYFAFLTLPRQQFVDMCVLYAFMRHTDDLADAGGVPAAQKRTQLDAWRSDFDAALTGDVKGPLLPAVGELVRRYDIPPRYFHAVLDGVVSDLDPRQSQTFEELQQYCYQVAGAVGLCCLHIWGYTDDAAEALAIDTGTAFQLTNILRDLREDALQGRTYLPAEDLDRFHYGVEDIRGGVCDERFRELMRFEVERARNYYEQSAGLPAMISPSARPALRAMRRIYGRLLERIEQRDYDVFSRPIRLSRTEKLLIATGGVCRRLLRSD